MVKRRAARSFLCGEKPVFSCSMQPPYTAAPRNLIVAEKSDAQVMIWYDFVILAILVYGAWQGAARGLVMQLAWIVAIILCFKFAEKLAPQIESHISVEQPLRHWIAMFILYLGFSLGSFLAARSLSNAIEKAKFKDFDRHLGGLFGLIKGAVLSLVLTFFAVTLSDRLQETVVRSKTGHIACVILDTIRPLTPEDAHPIIHDSLAKYKEALKPADIEELGEPSTTLDDFIEDVQDVIGSDQSNRENDFGQGSGIPSRGSSRGVSYAEFLGALDPTIQRRIGDSLNRTWNRLSADQQIEITDTLRYAPWAEIESTLNRLYSQSGGQGSAAPIRSPLIDEIASAYDDPQGTKVGINHHLTGVPEDIQRAVLEDWYADLTMADRDPDPRTNINTRLDDRILNQLDRSSHSIDQLAWDLRTRLQRSR